MYAQLVWKAPVVLTLGVAASDHDRVINAGLARLRDDALQDADDGAAANGTETTPSSEAVGVPTVERLRSEEAAASAPPVERLSSGSSIASTVGNTLSVRNTLSAVPAANTCGNYDCIQK